MDDGKVTTWRVDYRLTCSPSLVHVRLRRERQDRLQPRRAHRQHLDGGAQGGVLNDGPPFPLNYYYRETGWVFLPYDWIRTAIRRTMALPPVGAHFEVVARSPGH